MTHNPSLYATTADRAELAAVKLLLQAMKTHGATAYLVNIMSGSARFARDERFGFCGRYRNVTERDASVIGCMSRARVPNYVETKRDAAGQSADQAADRPRLAEAWGSLRRALALATSREPAGQSPRPLVYGLGPPSQHRAEQDSKGAAGARRRQRRRQNPGALRSRLLPPQHQRAPLRLQRDLAHPPPPAMRAAARPRCQGRRRGGHGRHMCSGG